MSETNALPPINERRFGDRDDYGRKQVAEKVIRLLKSDIDVSPMVIDGGWGAGKSEFCHKLINLFNDEQAKQPESEKRYRCIYVDAFKADHADEPLMTLIAAVAEKLPPDRKRFLLKEAVPAVRFAAKTSGKALISWVLRQDAVDLGEAFEKEVKQAGDAALDAAVESALHEHVEAQKSMQTLRDALRSQAEKEPVIIFVDELDRCRPDFAVSMLENIKHVFDVDGVEFVLVTNTDQLRASIKHIYGIDSQAQRYLDKFIGFSFRLPNLDGEHQASNTHAAEKHFHHLVMHSSELAQSCVRESGTMEFAREIIRANHATLREAESFVRYLEIYHVITNKTGLARNVIFGFQLLRIFAVYLFFSKPEICKNILQGHYDAGHLINCLGVQRLHSLEDGMWNSHGDFLAVLFALEADVVPDHLTVKDEHEAEGWGQHIREHFRGRLRHGTERHIEAIAEVFRDFELGAAR